MIETMPFGSTGHNSSRVIFGAAALGGMRQDKADELLVALLNAGVNHIDTAAAYGDSELRLAPWLAQHPTKFFLATKTGDRSGEAARASVERSLERMGVDHVDLIQLHNLVEKDDWERAFAPGGAVEALFAARDEGLCRFVGVTGHGLRIARMHIHSLSAAPFASVLLPYSHILMQDPGYAADFGELSAVCADKGVAMQTIKAAARRRWPEDIPARFSWYQPIEDHEVLARAVQYALMNRQVFVNTSSNGTIMRQTLEIAAAYDDQPVDPAALEADELAHGMRPIFDGGVLEVI